MGYVFEPERRPEDPLIWREELTWPALRAVAREPGPVSVGSLEPRR
jgi:hypothetical protein